MALLTLWQRPCRDISADPNIFAGPPSKPPRTITKAYTTQRTKNKEETRLAADLLHFYTDMKKPAQCGLVLDVGQIKL